MKRIRLGESQPATAVITGASFIFGAVLLFFMSRRATLPGAWRWQFLGGGALLAAVRVGEVLARRFGLAYVLISPSAFQLHQHGALWPGASIPRKLVASASELRMSDTGPLWSLRVHFVDGSERDFGSFLNPSIHDAVDEINVAIRQSTVE